MRTDQPFIDSDDPPRNEPIRPRGVHMAGVKRTDQRRTASRQKHKQKLARRGNREEARQWR